MRRWPLTSFGSYRPGPYPHKDKGVCVRDVCAIYDNNISSSLIMIIIKMIILYFIQIRHTDAFPPTGTLLVGITESWANNDITDAELGLEGYVMFRKDRMGRRG